MPTRLFAWFGHRKVYSIFSVPFHVLVNLSKSVGFPQQRFYQRDMGQFNWFSIKTLNDYLVVAILRLSPIELVILIRKSKFWNSKHDTIDSIVLLVWAHHVFCCRCNYNRDNKKPVRFEFRLARRLQHSLSMMWKGLPLLCSYRTVHFVELSWRLTPRGHLILQLKFWQTSNFCFWILISVLFLHRLINKLPQELKNSFVKPELNFEQAFHSSLELSRRL